jgi:hypothetical protein
MKHLLLIVVYRGDFKKKFICKCKAGTVRFPVVRVLSF